MNIKPLADRVLILPAPAEEKTIGGIIIPDVGHRYRQGRRSRRSAGHPRRGASPAVRAPGRDRQQDPDPVWWERQTGQCR